MPAGPAPLGFAYFLAAKFAGYTAFCHWVVAPRIGRTSGDERAAPIPVSPLGAALVSSSAPTIATSIPSSVKAGVIRTLIGVAVGAAAGFGFWTIPYFSTHDWVGSVSFFLFLVPVRIGEWALLYRWIYKIHPLSDLGGMKLITFGILASFILDF